MDEHGKLLSTEEACENFCSNHKTYNFLACDWFKKVLFSTNSLAKLLWDSLLLDSLFVIGQFDKPITFKDVV